jgi:hypothetical protein
MAKREETIRSIIKPDARRPETRTGPRQAPDAGPTGEADAAANPCSNGI